MTSPIKLHYREQGEGPPLVILHGLFGSGMNWNRAARQLSDRFRVFTLDLRNHGHSPHAATMTYPEMASDVARFLDDTGLEQAAVMGHSMGGKIGMTLALEHPERVSRLLVADMAPVPYGNRDHHRLIRAMLHVDIAHLASRREADDELRQDVHEPGIRQFLLTNLEPHDNHWRWRVPLEILQRNLDTIADYPALDGRFAGPTLFLHGEQSDYVLPEHHQRIHDLFPQARIEALSGAGHWLHVDDPEGFLARSAAFLGEEETT